MIKWQRIYWIYVVFREYGWDGSGLQQICRIDKVDFQGQAQMRLKQFYITTMLLSVALCAIAAERPISSPTPDPSSTLPDLPSSTLTFDQFKLKYSKKYDSLAQQAYRRWIFTQNMQKLNEHNQDPNRKYNMKPNGFMDITDDEFRSVYTTTYASDSSSKQKADDLIHQSQCQKGDCRQDSSENNKSSGQKDDKNMVGGPEKSDESVRNTQTGSKEQMEKLNPNRNLQILTMNADLLAASNSSKPNPQTTTTPSTSTAITSTKTPSKIFIDWQHYAGPVRFQGFCGACYAFSTVDTFSSHLAIKSYGFFYQLSVQQIVDCSQNGLTFGCYGGYLQGALTYMQMQGIVSQTSYPFVSGSKGFSNKCQQKSGPFKVKSFTPLPQASCSSIISHLYDGPISAGISGYKLRFYSSGIFNQCGPYDRLDHAVMIVGYRNDKGWRIKNSWGGDWGEGGFGWIAEGNTCGICNMTVAIRV